MKNIIVRKVLVLGIIVLFVGTGSVPVTLEVSAHNIRLSESQVESFQNLIFDRVIDISMKLALIPSLSACIIKNDRVVWSKGYGLCDIEREKRASGTTMYMIGSVSKTVTATAIMQLYEQVNSFDDLDLDINEFLDFSLRNPYYPDTPITFRMLLSHTASLATEPDYYHGIVYAADPAPLESWIKSYFYTNGSANRYVWRNITPGIEFHYVSIDYCLLGYLVERISGQSFNEYCKEHIFMPLNMTNTSFYLSDVALDHLAVPYLLEDRSFMATYFPLQYYSWRMYAAGNMMTSVTEFSHFLIAHMNGGVYNGVRILNESSITEMHRIQTPNKYKGLHYGLGFFIWQNLLGQKTFIGHPGAIYGGDTIMKIRLSDNVAVMYCTNRAANRELTGKIAHFLIEHTLFAKAVIL